MDLSSVNALGVIAFSGLLTAHSAASEHRNYWQPARQTAQT